MINLLPPSHKTTVTYARRNTVLKNWVLASCVGVAGLILVVAAGQLFISRSTHSWQKQVDATNQQLKDQKLEETQKKVADISDSVKLTTQVLSRQVLFSKLLAQIGAAIPSGTSLQSLSISSPEGGIDLTAVARDYQTATQIQINLQDANNKIFEKADIINVSCNNDTAKSSDYPCQVSIRALFAKDNAFQYATGSTKASN